MHYASNRGWCIIDDPAAVQVLAMEQEMDLDDGKEEERDLRDIAKQAAGGLVDERQKQQEAQRLVDMLKAASTDAGRDLVYVELQKSATNEWITEEQKQSIQQMLDAAGEGRPIDEVPY